jgi:hypothetical protein
LALSGLTMARPCWIAFALISALDAEYYRAAVSERLRSKPKLVSSQ